MKGTDLRAQDQIEAALSDLGSPFPPRDRAGQGNRPQAVSDGISRDTVTTLQTVQSRLTAPRGARTAAERAIGQLHTALTVH
jgi:hypothetical protein